MPSSRALAQLNKTENSHPREREREMEMEMEMEMRERAGPLGLVR